MSSKEMIFITTSKNQRLWAFRVLPIDPAIILTLSILPVTSRSQYVPSNQSVSGSSHRVPMLFLLCSKSHSFFPTAWDAAESCLTIAAADWLCHRCYPWVWHGHHCLACQNNVRWTQSSFIFGSHPLTKASVMLQDPGERQPANGDPISPDPILLALLFSSGRCPAPTYPPSPLLYHSQKQQVPSNLWMQRSH